MIVEEQPGTIDKQLLRWANQQREPLTHQVLIGSAPTTIKVPKSEFETLRAKLQITEEELSTQSLDVIMDKMIREQTGDRADGCWLNLLFVHCREVFDDVLKLCLDDDELNEEKFLWMGKVLVERLVVIHKERAAEYLGIKHTRH